MNLKCRIGQHQWSVWEYQTAALCVQKRVCLRSGCNAAQEQSEHTMTEWTYEADDRCEQISVCQRCGVKGQQIQHIWIEVFVASDDDKKKTICQRCKQVKSRFDPIGSIRNAVSDEQLGSWQCQIGQHQWDNWEPDPDDACKEFQTCLRPQCNSRQERNNHQMSEWLYRDERTCDQVQTCHKCDFKMSRVEHNWQQIADEENPSQTITICSRCNMRDGSKKASGFIKSMTDKVATIDVQPVKCLAGYHQWNSWEDVEGDTCKQTRYCLRSGCDKVEYKATHQMSAWVSVEENSCYQVSTCSQCDFEEHQAMHHWRQAYVEEGACDTVKICKRCGEEGSPNLVPSHDWDNWTYVSDNSCHQHRFCRRCRQEQRREVKHEWDAWQKADGRCRQTRTCVRCQLRAEESVEHVWSSWQDVAPDQCREKQTCLHCGKNQFRAVGHHWNDWHYVSHDECIKMQACLRCGEKRDKTIIEHDWDDWKWLPNSCIQQKICKRCGVPKKRIKHDLQTVQIKNPNQKYLIAFQQLKSKWLEMQEQDQGFPDFETFETIEAFKGRLDRSVEEEEKSRKFGEASPNRLLRIRIELEEEVRSKTNFSYLALLEQITIKPDATGRWQLFDTRSGLQAEQMCYRCNQIKFQERSEQVSLNVSLELESNDEL